MDSHAGYAYRTTDPSHAHSYLWEPVSRIIRAEMQAGSIFEVGCGNGATAAMLSSLGYEVMGVDPAVAGIELANQPSLRIGSAYDDLAGEYGQFQVVLSLEVVEHCFHPRKYAQTIFNLTKPSGLAIISTPFHGYWKNLALAIAGKMDSHFTALWDGGHIKFWSEKTLKQLLGESGFSSITFLRVGRVPPFAKSMIALARKPPGSSPRTG